MKSTRKQHSYLQWQKPLCNCITLHSMASTQGRRALVLYGSETGNAQDVAEELGRIAERLRFHVEVTELNAINLVCPGAYVHLRKVEP